MGVAATCCGRAGRCRRPAACWLPLAAALLVASLSGVARADAAGAPLTRTAGRPCACSKIYSPVCAAGVTYANECEARCNAATVDYAGKCADAAGCAAVTCPFVYDPVCGANGRTYSNRCMAECTGVTVVGNAACKEEQQQPQPHAPAPLPGDVVPVEIPDSLGHYGGMPPSNSGSEATPGKPRPCPCATLLPDPVCGWDGVSYASACEATTCAGVEVKHEGNCPDPAGCAAVLCPAIFAPVCGADGVTYPNQCQASCTGVTVLRSGPCEQELPQPPVLDPSGPCSCDPVLPLPLLPLPSPAACPADGVCGSDGVSYPSACAARCAGAEPEHIGRCPDAGGCAATTCMTVFQPVCGADLRTYPNECLASCTGVTIVRWRACEDPPLELPPSTPGGPGSRPCGPCATLLPDPVCGWDGVSYASACEATTCAGVEVKHEGNCPDPAGCAAVACTADYNPVCGADGVTYSNDCTASCTGVTVIARGPCEDPMPHPHPHEPVHGPGYPIPELPPVLPPGESCICTLELRQVCGSDGVTYDNPCLARCAGAAVQYDGCCKEEPAHPTAPVPCMCTREYDPVCGKDGVTYDNPCMARCARTEAEHEGACEDPSGCAVVRCRTEDEPVCGANGKVYRNACFAMCTGITYYPGRCPHNGSRDDAHHSDEGGKGGSGAEGDQGGKGGKGGKRGKGGKGGKGGNGSKDGTDDVGGKGGKDAGDHKGGKGGHGSSNSSSGHGPRKLVLPQPLPAHGARGKVGAEACACVLPAPNAEPVCGSDGIKYGSDCLARCSGVQVVACGQ